MGNSEDKIIDVEANDSISTGTHKVGKEVAEWIQELIESPEVYIELDSDSALHNKRVPVVITNKSTAICNSFDGMFNVNIKYRFGFKKNIIKAN